MSHAPLITDRYLRGVYLCGRRIFTGLDKEPLAGEKELAEVPGSFAGFHKVCGASQASRRRRRAAGAKPQARAAGARPGGPTSKWAARDRRYFDLAVSSVRCAVAAVVGRETEVGELVGEAERGVDVADLLEIGEVGL